MEDTLPHTRSAHREDIQHHTQQLTALESEQAMASGTVVLVLVVLAVMWLTGWFT